MQENWGCIIGRDYPYRIVVHEDASKENIQRMAQAYANNKLLRDASCRGEGNAEGVDSSSMSSVGGRIIGGSKGKKRSGEVLEGGRNKGRTTGALFGNNNSSTDAK